MRLSLSILLFGGVQVKQKHGGFQGDLTLDHPQCNTVWCDRQMLNRDHSMALVCRPPSLCIPYNSELHIQCPEGLQGLDMGTLPLLVWIRMAGWVQPSCCFFSSFLSPFPLVLLSSMRQKNHDRVGS